MTGGRQRRQTGFTLVELLIVVSMVAVLASISWAGFAYLQQKSARLKTRAMVTVLAAGLHRHHAERGFYPAHEAPSGEGGSGKLFAALYMDGVRGSGKVYVADLNPASELRWTRMEESGPVIFDAWGGELRYRTGSAAENPDFDLWSAGPDGETDPGDPGAPSSRDDIRRP